MDRASKNEKTAKINAERRAELRYYGINSCLALWRNRPEEIIRVYLLEIRKREFGELLRWCAQTKRGYKLVSAEELEKITKSTHHEGVCIQAVRRDALDFDDLSKKDFDSLPPPIVYCDGIGNPHNFGSLLRAASHFGAGLVFGERGKTPTLSAATCRIAEGGAESMPIAETAAPAGALKLLKKRGYKIIGTASEAKRSLYSTRFPEKTVFIFGAEREGVSKSVASCADEMIFIPGSGGVENLNVAAASAVVLSEYSRQQSKS